MTKKLPMLTGTRTFISTIFPCLRDTAPDGPLKQLIQEGLGGVPGKITSSPAKHLASLCNQMVNFLGIMQNEWAGAQAFSSFDTYLAPFVKVDHLSYYEVKKLCGILYLRRQHAKPLGNAGPLLQHYSGLDCSR